MGREPSGTGTGGEARGRWPLAFFNVFRETHHAWPSLTAYQRFEQIVSIVLTIIVSLVVAVAVVHLVLRVVPLVLFGPMDPVNQAVFQAIFGMIMTVLIALEFNHSILGVLERRNSIVQVKTVVLIALLALVRKFIILDATTIDPMTLLGLAASILALGGVHWMVREQDRRTAVKRTGAEAGASRGGA